MRRGTEVGPGQLEQPMFKCDYGLEINCALGKGTAFLTIASRQQAVFDQKVGADQQGIASEGGQAGVRRVAEAGWPQWQSLPPGLAGLVQPVNPGKGGRAHVADAVRRWQRRYMQQDARRSGLCCERWKSREPRGVSHRSPFSTVTR